MRAAVAAAALALAACHAPHTASLRGMVVIDGDGDASGVGVRAVGPASASTTTDASGAWVLPSLPPGDYELVFTAEATLEGTQVVRATAAGTLTAPLVRFTAVGSVAGTVTLAGQPGGGATVFVDGANAVATSDAAGHYRIDGVPAGTVTVEAVLAGYKPGSLGGITVTRAQVTSAPALDLAVDGDAPYPAAALSGVALRIDQMDSSGTQVTATHGASTFTTTTAKDGSYHFDGIPTGLYQLAFDYDGHHETIPQVLALAGSTGQVVDGALYPLASNPLRLPVARRLVDAGGLTPIDSGRVLYFTHGADPHAQSIAVLSLTTGALTPIADDVDQGSPMLLSPDKTHLLYVAGAGTWAGALRLGALDGSAPVTLAPLSDEYGGLFTPDGAHVVFTANRTELHTVPSAGGADTVLASGVESWWLHPDGKRVVYESCTGASCSVFARTLDGAAPVHVLDTKGGYLQLAPDGAHVAAFSGYDETQRTGQVLVAAIDGSATTTLWNGVTDNTGSFSSDGRWFAFVTDGGMSGGDLRLADLRSAAPTAAVVAQSAFGPPTFTADGSRFLYRRDVQWTVIFYSLFQQPAGGGAEVSLGTHVSEFALSPDGTRTVVIDQVDASTGYGRLRTVDASGAATTLALSGAHAARFVPDGAHVVYQTIDPSSDTTAYVWSVAAGGGTPIDLGELYPYSLVDAPDGAHVAATAADHTIWVMPTAGGAAQAAGDGYASWASPTRLLLDLNDRQPPYRHQNGVYVLEVAP